MDAVSMGTDRDHGAVGGGGVGGPYVMPAQLGGKAAGLATAEVWAQDFGTVSGSETRGLGPEVGKS